MKKKKNHTEPPSPGVIHELAVNLLVGTHHRIGGHFLSIVAPLSSLPSPLTPSPLGVDAWHVIIDSRNFSASREMNIHHRSTGANCFSRLCRCVCVCVCMSVSVTVCWNDEPPEMDRR